VDQEGKCAICFKIMDAPNVDHCHKTGKVRGLLCSLCNKGIGLFHDDIEKLLQAVEYLNANK